MRGPNRPQQQLFFRNKNIQQQQQPQNCIRGRSVTPRTSQPAGMRTTTSSTPHHHGAPPTPRDPDPMPLRHNPPDDGSPIHQRGTKGNPSQLPGGARLSTARKPPTYHPCQHRPPHLTSRRPNSTSSTSTSTTSSTSTGTSTNTGTSTRIAKL